MDDGGGFISYINYEPPNFIGVTLNAIKTDELGNISCSTYQSNLLLNTIDTSHTISNLLLTSSTIPIITSNTLENSYTSYIEVIDCTVMGLSSLNLLNKIELFPNPTQGKLSFSIAPNKKLII